MDIYSQFKDSFISYSFIPERATILLAYSGGRDSSALLHLLIRLQKERPLSVQAAYFNHGIRKDAALEEDWVRQICSKLGINLIVGHADIPGLLQKNGGNLEETASQERYRFLQNSRSCISGPSFLATAHHAGDQLETFLFRLARGTGPQGMLGIASHVNEQIIRPLHTITPKQIATFLNNSAIPYYTDNSNDNLRFSRNRIRHLILPELEKINAGMYKHFIHALSLLEEEDQFLQAFTEHSLKMISPYPAVLNRPAFLKQHPALAKRIMRLFIHNVRGSLRSIDHLHIDGLLQAINQQKKAYQIPGMTVSIGRQWVLSTAVKTQSFNIQLEACHGSLQIDKLGSKINVHPAKALRINPKNCTVTVPRLRIIFPLTVRSVQAQDRYRLDNTDFEQNVWEMLRERGIPKELRPLFPIVINGDGKPIWCFSCPLAASFHCPIPATTGVEKLRISIQNHPFERFLTFTSHL